jgi:hypothetical protein
MSQCKNIIHPFQNDPGVSQRQRLIPELDVNAPKIDGRTLADLLDYFTRLSRHINYYDANLATSDWQPFFNKSIPFNLSSISKYEAAAVEGKFGFYRSLFYKRPGKRTLQLVVHYMYYSTIYRINTWHKSVDNSQLVFEQMLENLVTDRLMDPVKSFIALANSAAREHCIKSVNFKPLVENGIWNLEPSDLTAVDTSLRARRGSRNRLMGMMEALSSLWPAMIEAVKLLSGAAEHSIEDSLFSASEELKQEHTPHLALLFAFLKLFQHLQSDLNGFTKKHLDFFFKDVLRLQPRDAEADKAHIVFEIQKQLDTHLLKKGVQVKDAKDKNNAEILFELDDEIVVNKAQVEEVRTLFLNSELAHDNSDLTLLEGVYMAPKSDKADGISKDFPDGAAKNWPTLGARMGRFTNVGETSPEPYPYARIGFILASPVLLLNEGKRDVTITLSCSYRQDCSPASLQPSVLSASDLALLNTALTTTYYIVTEEGIALAQKKGVTKGTVQLLNSLLELDGDLCCEDSTPGTIGSIQLSDHEWKIKVLNNIVGKPNEVKILGDIFLPQRAISVYFSGKDAWIEPSSLIIQPLPAGPSFPFVIKAVLDADKKAVTYFDKEKLKEDLQTKLPLVRIEINQEIKMRRRPGAKQPECCFENCPSPEEQYISLYQLLRDLHVEDAKIDVQVCGVKNLLVRNDENLLNVNSPMAAFGVRPKVDSSFYIGSKEIFGKNWKDIYVNTEWKDRPADFSDHYEHYFYENFEDGSSQITNNSFRLKAALLEKGEWQENGEKGMFVNADTRAAFCNHPAPMGPNQNVYHYARTNFPGAYATLPVDTAELPPLDVNSTYGFLRLTLKGVGFQHDRYPFVLARHMMALSNLVDPVSLNFAIVHLNTAEDLADAMHNRIDNIINNINSLQGHIATLVDRLMNNEPGPFNPALDGVTILVTELNNRLNLAVTQINAPDIPAALATLGVASSLITQINSRLATITSEAGGISTDITAIDFSVNNDPDGDLNTANTASGGLHELVISLQARINDIQGLLKVNEALKNGLPKEAYTPLAKDLTLDYTATADISDIELVHLYPFENTHKEEEITLSPALFPTHCDQGTLFIGLKQLVPGSNVNFLFQLAEATANSESDAAEVVWHYLSNNQWKPLRSGFEVIEDATNKLTTSGIVKISIPADINTDNTVLPNSLHWIKASAPRNVIAVSETLGIHTQAVRATFVNTAAHDQIRLSAPLEAGKLSKLQEANANVKKVAQPYESFGGKVPEAEGNYYIRVSEWLRHKGRGIQKFDYERLVLDAFPEIYKVKCINHTFWAKATLYRTDVNVAPGYVMVAVIPDLNKLKSGQSFEPKAPLSLLEKIAASLKKRTSPFARIKVVNPRYEKIDICIEVALHKGKDRVFYRSKLAEDLRLFLAPWAVGEFEKLDFGQCVNRSDVVRFIEGRDYVDYIIGLKMMFEEDCTQGKVETQYEVCPLTPRSILVAGEIDVCIPEFDCDEWDDVPDRCSKKFPVATLECRPPATDNPIPVDHPPIG